MAKSNTCPICHQWREIALNGTLFWDHIDLTTFSSAGTAEILTRAKNTPLIFGGMGSQ